MNTSIYLAIGLSLKEISYILYARALEHALMTQKSCAVGMRNAKLGNHLNQLLFYSFLILLRSISPGSNIYNPLRNANYVKRWSYWKFVLKIKKTSFMKTQNSKIFRGSMPPDPPSKKRLHHSIVNRASNIHLGTPPCKKASYAPVILHIQTAWKMTQHPNYNLRNKLQ